ncbi:phage portal protein [Anaerosporobacter sp.]|uniref:phage portal protein n=1 Tax=Anaerosporobacter sp. TaxID=1872529 RepID=UPI00286F7118|nr:phage portal protein [Anaerosporobacter sp.]
MIREFERNRLPFTELCRGDFGRKQIFTNVKEISKDNIIKVLGDSIATHWSNRAEIRYLDRYYRGDQPILYMVKKVRPEINNKIVENHALEIVRFMNAQKFGEAIQYINRTKDENITKMVDSLNDLMSALDKYAHDIELGEWQSICGTAYRFIWIDNSKEYSFDLETLNPMNTFVVYSTGNGKKPLMSVQLVKSEKGKNQYQCYTNKEYFLIEGSKVIEEKPNGMFRIPIVEFPNNSRRLSDIEIVSTMLDAINSVQSNRLNGIEQFVQAFMKFVNCEIDEDDFLKMCELGAIAIKGHQGVTADVDLISQQLDQEQTQVSKDDLYKNILIIEGMPSREQNTGGDTGQAVYLRNGWDFAEQRAELIEPIIIRSEKRFLDIVFYILKTKNKDIKLDIKDIDVKITRNKTDNMLVKSQALLNYLSAGLNPKIAIASCEAFGDPEKVYMQSKDYLDAKYKTVNMLKEEVQSQSEMNGGDNNVI